VVSPNFAPKFAVIPAELVVASASRNPGFKRKLDYRFRGNDEKGVSIYSWRSETDISLAKETSLLEHFAVPERYSGEVSFRR